MTSAPVSKPLTLATGIAVIAVIAVFDYVTGYEVRLFPLYFLPVAFVAWRLSRTAAVAMSLVSAGAWALSNWLAGTVYSSSATWPINVTSQAVAFGTVGLLVAELRRRLVAAVAESRQDRLTSLPNGRAFHEGAELLLAVARRSGRPLTFAYVDLDNFKQVNDQRGHDEGDRALQETARVLRGQLRAGDLVARLGGDEFAVVLPDTGPDEARASLNRVRELVAAAMREHEWPVTVSVGAVSYARVPATVDQAIHEADSLMYRAKEAGKNRVHVEVGGPDAAAPPSTAREPRRAP